MVKFMFEMPTDADFEMLYGNLKLKGLSHSGLRHSFVEPLDNAVIIIDEFQNLNYHELDSIITRVGENSKIIPQVMPPRPILLNPLRGMVSQTS